LRRLAARLGHSDVVQQTCLPEQRNFARFEGRHAAEFLAWLRPVHEKELQNAWRGHVGAK
jgi:DNA-directed RNA polymerase specialized sigma24 family protein